MKRFQSALAIVIALLLALSAMPVFALQESIGKTMSGRDSCEGSTREAPDTGTRTQSHYQNFSSNYVLTGNGASDMVAVALAQEGMSGSRLGYTEDWCADFVGDCAILAHQSTAVPLYGGVPGLRTRLINAGGIYVSVATAQPGDLCIIDWNGNGNNNHIEIVYSANGSSVSTIGGNTGSGTISTRTVKKHNPLSNSVITCIIRPNYSYNPISIPAAPQNVHSDTNLYSESENINFYWDASDSATDYWVYLWKEGTKLYESNIGNNTMHTCAPLTAGYYTLVVKARNSAGYSEGESQVDFMVYSNLGDDFYGVILNHACWKPIEYDIEDEKIYLQTETGVAQQKWRFQRQSDGSYTIASCYDGKVLEMTDGIRENYTQLTARNNWLGAYQRWYLIPYQNGYLFYCNHYSSEGWCMDLSDGNPNDDTPIIIYSANLSSAQIWAIYTGYDVQLKPTNLNISVCANTVSCTWERVYGTKEYGVKIWDNSTNSKVCEEYVTSTHFSTVLPAGSYRAYIDSIDYFQYFASNVVEFEISDSAFVEPCNIGDDFYAFIEHQSTGLLMTNQNNNIAGEAALGSSTQIWHFIRQANGSYAIISAYDNSCIDVCSSNLDNGTNVLSWSGGYLGQANQQFYIYQAYGAYYFIPVHSNGTMALDMSLSTHTLEIWEISADWEPQKFNIQKTTYPTVDVNSVNFTIGEVSAAPGSDISVDFCIDGEYEASALTVYISYDADKLTLNSINQGQVWNDMLNLNANIMSYTSVAGSIRFIAIVPTAYFSTSGTIFTMNFHVKENVTIGTDIPLGIDIREFFVSPIGGTEAQIPYAVTNGVIHVNCLPGDVNGDGVVNSMDIIIIMRYALGINNLNASQLIAADYNGDGQVNASDALMMMRISLGIA